jgi:uncharacterized protein (TIGR03437 family)
MQSRRFTITEPFSLFAFPAIAVLLAAPWGAARAQTLNGTLSNFDVFNDTGQVSRGFEIELDGLTSKDISYTFGGTYIRYGNPAVTDFPGGVLVRYASAYDAAQHSFATGTPIPPPGIITTTLGHQCWTGGAPGYPSSGCEHFGVGLTRNPTSVVYRWLVEDSANPGTLKSAGTNVNIAAPAWSVAAAAGGAAVVNADIDPPRAPAAQFGDAVWVKVYETESPNNVDLNHLLTDDPVVPQGSAQPEVEWELSQNNPKKADHGSLQHGKPLGKGSQSVIRRFEFYKYTGAYDPESHEALCSARQGGKGSDCKGPGPGELGDYIGAQMAAAQFGQVAAPKSAVSSVSNSANGQTTVSTGSWVSIYGSNLSTTTRPWQNSDFQGTKLPLALDGVSVTIDNRPAAVAFISPGQINVQAPASDSVGPVEVKVTNSLGAVTGSVSMAPFSPAFFSFSGKYAAAVHYPDGALVAPVGFFGAGVPSRPAKPGETILIFGTGFGPTAPAIAPGQVVSASAPLVQASGLRIRIGGLSADVTYAGIVAAGEYQFNVVVPPLADGDQAIAADAGGVSSAAGLTIAVKN